MTPHERAIAAIEKAEAAHSGTLNNPREIVIACVTAALQEQSNEDLERCRTENAKLCEEHNTQFKRLVERIESVGDVLDEAIPNWEGDFCDAIRQLHGERDALAAALEKYRRHMPPCSARLTSGMNACTCGFAEAENVIGHALIEHDCRFKTEGGRAALLWAQSRLKQIAEEPYDVDYSKDWCDGWDAASAWLEDLAEEWEAK